MIEVEETILFWAFRYALGRMTYVVGDVGDHIIRNVQKISWETKKKIISEIKEKEYKNELGMQCDKTKWIEVKEALRSTIIYD